VSDQRLPEKLSALIRLAVADAKSCEADSKYELNMSTWFHRGEDECSVCMAGAVMARTLGVPEGAEFAGPAVYRDRAITNALFAVNYTRIGDIHSALWSVCVLYPHWAKDARLRNAVLGAEKVIHDEQVFGLGRASWEAYLAAAQLLDEVGL